MIAIFCASKIEILSLLKKIKVVKKFHSGQVRGFTGIYRNNSLLQTGENILILFTGMGKKNAIVAADYFISEFIVDKDPSEGTVTYFHNKKSKQQISNIIVTGFGGSMVKDIKIKEIVLINEIKALLDLKGLLNNKGFKIVELGGPLNSPGIPINNIFKAVPLATVEEVITDPVVKKEINKTTGASILDMETFWIAERLSGSDIPLTYLRVISDDLENNIPASLNLNPTGNTETQQNPVQQLILLSGIFLRSIFYLMIRPLDLIRTIKFLNDIFSAQKVLSKVIEDMINDLL